MKTKNSEIMMHAREALVGKWGLAIGVMLVHYLLLAVASAIPFLPLIIGGPMFLGLTIFSLSIARKENSQFEQLFEGFRRFGVSLAAFLLMILFVVLWSLLLIIPGIVAALSYSLVFYIIADDRTVTATEALQRSKKMMRGNKWKLFCLGFRFFGWFLLSVLTFGIGFLWLVPYMQVSFAKFYEEVKKGNGEA